MAEGAMASFLTNIGTFFTQSVTWMGDVLTYITTNAPLTILVLAFPIIGFVVSLLRKIMYS